MLGYINNLIAPIQLIATILLLYQLYNFKSNNIFSDPTKQRSEEKVVKITTPVLNTKGSFIYFEGKIGKSFRMSDTYPYSPKYPSEIFDGYIAEAKNNNGDTFFIWSRYNRILSDLKIKGWFFTDNISTFQVEEDIYAQVLYPIVEKQIDSDNKIFIP